MYVYTFDTKTYKVICHGWKLRRMQDNLLFICSTNDSERQTSYPDYCNKLFGLLFSYLVSVYKTQGWPWFPREA